MLSVKNLEKHFHNKIIGPFSFSLKQGEILFVAGKSGEGKSTILKMLTGLLPFEKGEIQAGNITLTPNASEEKWKRFRQKYGIVFQYSGLLDSLNIFENIALKLLEENKETEKNIRKKVENILDLTELPTGILSLYPSEISGGMQKRVAFARAVLHHPEYLFLDEPTSGLDPILAERIDELTLKIRKKLQTTIIIISHDIVSIKNMADKILVIKDHKQYFLGTHEELKEQKNNSFLNHFFYRKI